MSRALAQPVRISVPNAGVDGRGIAGALPRDPTVNDGRIGDFWINTDSKHLFGPKVPAATLETIWPDKGLIRGANGWYPVPAIVTDGARRVLQVDWAGGEGPKPDVAYVGATGLVADIADAQDIRGPEGPQALIDALTASAAIPTYGTLLATAEAGGENEKGTFADLFVPGKAMAFPDIATITGKTLPKSVQWFDLGCYDISVPGAGQARYRRVNAEPAHSYKIRLGDRWTADGNSDSVNGGWLEIVPDGPNPTIEQSGGVRNGVYDCFGEMTRMIDYSKAKMADRGGQFKFKIDGDGGPVAYAWNKLNTINEGDTTYNPRYCFLVENASDVTWDVSGVSFVKLGNNQGDWATSFRFRFCRNIINIGYGTELDYQNSPSAQGRVAVIGSDYIDFDLDIGTPPPSFNSVTQIEPHDDDLIPIAYGIAREQTTTQFGIADQGGGRWRITGFTPSEIASLTTRNIVPDRLIAVKGMKDGPIWFRYEKCVGIKTVGYECYKSADAFSQYHLCKNAKEENIVVTRKEGRKDIAVCMRGGTNMYEVGGTAESINCLYEWGGDDPIAIARADIRLLTRIDATTFTGTQQASYHFVYLDPGDKLDFCDQDGNVTASAVIETVTTDAYPRIRFTVSFTSGSMPADLTGYFIDVRSYDSRMEVINPQTNYCRARGIFAAAKSGFIVNPKGYGIGAEAIMIDYGGDGSADRPNSADITIINPQYKAVCQDLYSGAAFCARAARNGRFSPSPVPGGVKRILLLGGSLVDCPAMAAYGGAVEGMLVDGLYMEHVAYGNVNNGFYGSSLAGAIFGAANAKDVLFTRTTRKNCGAASVLKTHTFSGGVNDNVLESQNIDLDNPDAGFGFPHIVGFDKDVGIGTRAPLVRLHAVRKDAGGSKLGLKLMGLERLSWACATARAAIRSKPACSVHCSRLERRAQKPARQRSTPMAISRSRQTPRRSVLQQPERRQSISSQRRTSRLMLG